MKDSKWAGNVCLQPRRPVVSWVASREAWPASHESPPGVLCAVLGPPAQEGHGTEDMSLFLLYSINDYHLIFASYVEMYLYFNRQHNSLCQDSSQTLGSSASESDLMRQRFSVASHSRLPYLIVSDGFMITVLRFHNNVSPVGFLRSLLLDSTQRLENIRRNVMNSQVGLRVFHMYC